MSEQVSNRFLEKLRKHLETGVPYTDMSFTDEQKRRIEVCMDAYRWFATDPFMDLKQYIVNRWKRTYSELRNDLKVIDYISSFYVDGQRNISSMKVRHSADILMRNGASTGNMKALEGGAKLLMQLDRLDQPETPAEMGDQLINMPVIITDNVSRKFPGKRSSTDEEMERIRRKYGVKKDRWQEMVETETGEYVAAPEEPEEEDTDTFAQPEE